MKKVLYFPYLALVLASCGGDNGDNSVVAPEKRSEVSSVYELGACNMQNASEFIWVKNENATYFCDGIEWQSDAAISYSSNSIVEIISSSSALEVFVGDDFFSSSTIMSSSSTPSKELDSILKIESSSSLLFLPKSSSSLVKISSGSVLSSSSGTLSSSAIQALSNTFQDSRDGKTYKKVTIGSQTWMAENLNYNRTLTGYCYDNKESNCQKYGRLYHWDNASVACPSGWRLPSINDWIILINTIGDSSTAGDVLKSKNGWDRDYNGSDKYGFSVLPVGFFSPSDKSSYLFEGSESRFWTSTDSLMLHFTYSGTKTENRAYSVNLTLKKNLSYDLFSEKRYGYSVRCIRSTMNPYFIDSRDNNSYGIITIFKEGRSGMTKQIWMAENLKYKTKNSSCYQEDEANCEKYGRLYSWADAMDSSGSFSTNGKGCGYKKTCSPVYPVRGICPVGWHLPTKSEWENLFAAIGDSSKAGTILKSTSGWENGGNGIDLYGFSVLPAWGVGKSEAYFWTSTERSNNADAYCINIKPDADNVKQTYTSMVSHFSIRCVKD